ncbi:MAG: hypothetical protein ACE5JX_07275 [Acidobacteriota bacterium]
MKVGIFVIVASVILAVAIFRIGSQVGLFEDTFTAKTYLNNVSGLKPGDIILLGGVEVGNVTRVLLPTQHLLKREEMPPTQENQRTMDLLERLTLQETTLQQRLSATRDQLQQAHAHYDETLAQYGANTQEAARARQQMETLQGMIEDQVARLDDVHGKIEEARGNLQNIVVYLQVKSDYRDWIREDSNISLGSVGLLGDKYIEISLGRSSRPAQVRTEKVSTWLGDETQEVVLITGRRQAGFQELITGANDILTNFKTLSGKLEGMIGGFAESEGTVGKFFNDPSFFNNLNDTALSARAAADKAGQLMTDVSTGGGTLSRLIQDRELYDRLNDSVKSFQRVAAEINEGRGTLGKIVNDPSLYENADDVVANLRGITQRMESGEGTLGKLSKDEQLYDDIRGTLNQLTGFVQDVEAGKGTLGRLAKDEQLYENLNLVSSEVVKLLYDFRQNPKKFLTIKFELF